MYRTDRQRIQNEIGSELDQWSKVGWVAKFFWRDDDAVTDTPALRRLFQVARDKGITVALAVIPEQADAALARLLTTETCCVWQHGWNHRWYERGEFGDGRPLEAMKYDALSGQRRMDQLFGPQGWQRIFVPPFHEIAMPFKALLPVLGYLGVSAGVQRRMDQLFGPQGWQRIFVPPFHEIAMPFKALLSVLGYLGVSAGVPPTPRIEGVPELNAFDFMDWKAKKLLPESEIYALILEELKSRRAGSIPAARPIGLLTHHLVMDEQDWSVLSDLFSLLQSHEASHVCSAFEVFASPKLQDAILDGFPH
jgi:hypothetical protein